MSVRTIAMKSKIILFGIVVIVIGIVLISPGLILKMAGSPIGSEADVGILILESLEKDTTNSEVSKEIAQNSIEALGIINSAPYILIIIGIIILGFGFLVN